MYTRGASGPTHANSTGDLIGAKSGFPGIADPKALLAIACVLLQPQSPSPEGPKGERSAAATAPHEAGVMATATPTKAFPSQETGTPQKATPADRIRPPGDVLFVADGELKVWRAGGGMVETIYDPNEHGAAAFRGPGFSPARGGVVVVAAANSDQASPAMVQINLETREVSPLDLSSVVSETMGRVSIEELALSGDGRWLAFRVGLSRGPMGQASKTGGRLAAQSSEAGRALYLMDLSSRDHPREIARCSSPLEGEDPRGGNLVWNPAEDLLAWQDDEGLWTISPLGAPRVILANNKSKSSSHRVFELETWSPKGRYLHLRTQY